MFVVFRLKVARFFFMREVLLSTYGSNFDPRDVVFDILLFNIFSSHSYHSLVRLRCCRSMVEMVFLHCSCCYSPLLNGNDCLIVSVFYFRIVMIRCMLDDPSYTMFEFRCFYLS